MALHKDIGHFRAYLDLAEKPHTVHGALVFANGEGCPRSLDGWMFSFSSKNDILFFYQKIIGIQNPFEWKLKNEAL